MKIGLLLCFVLSIQSIDLFGQDPNSTNDKEAAYTRTINTRAEKIVQTLALSDSSKAKRVTLIIAGQYRNLNTLYTEREEQVKLIRQQEHSKESADKAIEKANEIADKKVEKLHSSFLAELSSELSQDQVTKVKDGMTYNVLKVTYDAYVDMIPALTTTQKDQIMNWLVEAREYAMDGESSEKKHWWFGKYKGRINNYLSAQGYDINKERKDWEERSKRKAEQKATNPVQ
ncbi:MAG: DUF3826 domain-containing protein [Flavisolibacter sp.]